MTIGKPQGIAILIFGLLLLTGGIIVLFTVPGWGSWLAAYPQQIAAIPAPPQAAPIVQGMGGVFGPLLSQVGHDLEHAGYFIGCLLCLVSLLPIGGGITLLRRAGQGTAAKSAV